MGGGEREPERRGGLEEGKEGRKKKRKEIKELEKKITLVHQFSLIPAATINVSER